MKRDHDKFYLNEDATKIKDSFIAVADEIEDNFSGKIADIGCAIGAFPAYLKSRFPSSDITGIEYLDTLLSKATAENPKIKFIKGDLMNADSINKKFDVITMLGVLCIFDDFEKALSNAIGWLRPNGKIILHNMINEYDIDVYVKYASSSSSFNTKDLENGWNIISKKSIEMVCKENSAVLSKIYPFDISLDLRKHDDVMRSWTEKDSKNNRMIFNALHIRQPQKIAVIQKI
tara:strand:- start:592 stop:1287 length:696 start_codon:yes stop_codon:yes gene_type:complete